MGSTSSGAAVTSSPTPTCALGLCRAHAWSDLLQLVESVPEAATADGSTAIYPLFAAIEERCSLAVLEALAAAHPQALHARDSRGRLPLHQALIQGAPSEVVFKLLALHPNGACSVMGDKGPLPLHLAIQKQADISVVKALVEVNGPAAKHADSEGRLPLHVAAAWKAPAAVVSSLLDLHPAAIHHADGNGFLPLHAAATGGALVSVLDLLIKANPQAAQCPDDFGFLPLHRAVANQASEDVIIALVKAYPEAVRLPDNDGMLPLHIAVENDAALPVVERLLALHPGAAGQADQDGFLPLHMAVHAGAAKDVICCLLSGFHGALHARETKDGMQPLHIAATRLDSLPLVPVLLEGCKDNEISIAAEKDASGNLPLYLASGFVCEGQEAAISVLLRTYPEGAATRAWDRGGLANTNVKCDGCGVLIPVGRRRYSSRLISDIDLCQSCFTGTKEITWDREEMELVKYGDLPLHRALASGAPVAVVRLLLDAYPDAAKLQNHEGCLPLQIAARRSKVLLIFEMILQCSDSDAVSASDHSGNLPLHSAVCRSEPVLGIVKLLLRSCPDTVLVANLAGQTPLQAAVAACAPAPVVHELLSAQALKLDADAHRQLVPAHGLVVQQQYLEIVSELLEKGMWDMGLWADSMGRAALDIAHADIKSRLLKAACFVRRYDIQSSRCLHESMTSLVLSATDYGVDPPCKVTGIFHKYKHVPVYISPLLNDSPF